MSKIKESYDDYEPEAPGPKTSMGYLDKFGREIPDPTPLEIAIGQSVASSMSELVAQLVQKAIHEHLGQDTFGPEAEDLDEDEDMSTYSPYSVELQDRALSAEIDRLKAERTSLIASSAPAPGAAPPAVSPPIGGVPGAGAPSPVDKTEKQ